MKSRHTFRSISLIAAFTIAFLVLGVQSAFALPPAPVPVSPASGSTIITPTFTWQASLNAAKYEVEVGPQADPNTVYWNAQTVNLTLTPVNGADFSNIALYWRVRALDSGGSPGAWSSKVNFTKQIPAPTLLNPANASNITNPEFEWQVVQGAVYYQVEFSTASNFSPVDDTYITYNTRIMPTNTITHGMHYWRVSGVDVDGHVGTASVSRTFNKDIPAPTLVSPANGHPNINIPTYSWLPALGAAYYKVEISKFSNFVPPEAAYITYNTQVTPVDAIALGLHYWRVSSVDADGHVGTPSAARTFTKFLEAPVLVSPEVNETITTPGMVWGAVDGAAYYKVELSALATFDPVLFTYSTYNLQFTPVDTLDLGTYYWRVSGVDAADHVGSGDWRKFTLNAPPAATAILPVLITPADTATIAADPTFSWSRMIGGHAYRLRVSQHSDFSPVYESVITHYNSYTPSEAGTFKAYPNGTYYWEVQALNSGGAVIGTSLARSFTKLEPLTLTLPADLAALTVDPTFQWNQIVGAKTYRLIVSKFSDFNPIYESIITDCTSYTPYSAGTFKAYPNGPYYWKVEARNSGGTVIATSLARSLTKLEVLPLNSPADGATGLVVDPTFQWTQIVGALDYRVVVSKFADFNPVYESIFSEYNSYTPFEAGTFKAYPNGTYYWKVEGRNSGGTVIATSAARSFTKSEPLTQTNPANAATGLMADPTFQWNQVVGAATYRLIVSKYADFNPVYESVITDYTTYTPYTAGTYSTYPDGVYYWKVEARNSGGTIITTSNNWSFTKWTYKFYLPIALRGSP